MRMTLQNMKLVNANRRIRYWACFLALILCAGLLVFLIKLKTSGCISCHQGVNLGGNMFQPFGVIGNYLTDRGQITKADLGRFNATKNEADRYLFRLPSLRNVAVTPPYFHDGSAKTLKESITKMTKYQLGRSLPTEQIELIAQFLGTLTGEYRGKPL
jgi:cytochrome c peroxidase